MEIKTYDDAQRRAAKPNMMMRAILHRVGVHCSYDETDFNKYAEDARLGDYAPMFKQALCGSTEPLGEWKSSTDL